MLFKTFDWWIIVGFLAQGLFFSRTLIQWLAIEKEKQIVVPKMYWWLSIIGSGILLFYSFHRKDIVFIIGQIIALIIYIRSLKFYEK